MSNASIYLSFVDTVTPISQNAGLYKTSRSHLKNTYDYNLQVFPRKGLKLLNIKIFLQIASNISHCCCFITIRDH